MILTGSILIQAELSVISSYLKVSNLFGTAPHLPASWRVTALMASTQDEAPPPEAPPSEAPPPEAPPPEDTCTAMRGSPDTTESWGTIISKYLLEQIIINEKFTFLIYKMKL